MRITGLGSSGLDIDQIVKDSMKPYQIKIDQTTQNKDVVSIKQQLYRDLMTQSSDFYNKYLDITKSDSLVRASNYKSVAFTSSNDSAVTAKATSEATLDNYTISVSQVASKASTTLSDGVTGQQTITFGSGATAFSINFTASNDSATTIDNFNNAIAAAKQPLQDKLNNGTITADEKNQLNALNVTAKHSDFSKGIVFQASNFGQGDFKINGTDSLGNPYTLSASDKYLNATMTNSKGETYTITDADKVTSNTKTIDGITFTFNDTTVKSGVDTKVTLTGKTDVTEIKDKIVKFVNDYNTLIKNLNTAVMTKHDKSYTPLTADQKKDMSADEIKLWDEQVKKGQLYKDSDITRIADSLKSSMRTLMTDSGLNLEQIGITPVKDYAGTLNGTFTIDEDKLTTALQGNTQSVMKLFTNSAPTDAELSALTPAQQVQRKSQTGILLQIKDTLYSETMKSDSILAKKVGMEGTSTFTNNELTKSIYNYETKVKDMQTDFSRREQALYSKYSTLEKMMDKLNSQQSALLSQLGR